MVDWDGGGGELDGRRWVAFAVGDRSAETLARLYARLPAAGLYRTDAYGVCGLLLVDRRVVGQGGAVNWCEGLHSVWRVHLNRLARRTNGYTKSVAMLVYSLALVCRYRWLKSNATEY